MKRTPISVDPSVLPPTLRPLFTGEVYDSSCSSEAHVFFLPAHRCFLKQAAPGTLAKEASLTAYFHSLGLAPAVLDYRTEEDDWLLTEASAGEDATSEEYLSDPCRLCDLLAETLRALHTLSGAGCPVPDRNADYLATAREGYRLGRFDPSFFPAPLSAEEALATVHEGAHLLQKNALLHGDYCLPNLLLDHWRFSAFIDLGGAGIGDRHIDLFWGAWTLKFNLGTDRYRERFFDAYGRDLVDDERLRLVAAAETLG